MDFYFVGAYIVNNVLIINNFDNIMKTNLMVLLVYLGQVALIWVILN